RDLSLLLLLRLLEAFFEALVETFLEIVPVEGAASTAPHAHAQSEHADDDANDRTGAQPAFLRLAAAYIIIVVVSTHRRFSIEFITQRSRKACRVILCVLCVLCLSKLRLHLLRLLHRFIDAANVHERVLRQMVVLAVSQFFEAADRLG